MHHAQRGISPWLGVIAAVVVFGGGWYFEARARRHDAADVQARLQRLEQAPPQAEEQGRPSGTPMTPAYASLRPTNAFGAPGASPVPRPLSPEERRRLQLQAISRLESRFSSDGSDMRWATSTEDAVKTAAEEPTLAPFEAPQASQIQCARTMCRLVFTFDSLDHAEDWSTYYPLGLARQLPVFQNQSTVLPDGRVELRMYGFRRPGDAPSS